MISPSSPLASKTDGWLKTKVAVPEEPSFDLVRRTSGVVGSFTPCCAQLGLVDGRACCRWRQLQASLKMRVDVQGVGAVQSRESGRKTLMNSIEVAAATTLSAGAALQVRLAAASRRGLKGPTGSHESDLSPKQVRITDSVKHARQHHNAR